MLKFWRLCWGICDNSLLHHQIILFSIIISVCFSIWDSRFIARSQSLESQAGSRISKANLDRVRSRPGLQCHCWAGHWSNWLPRANLTNWQAIDFTIEFWQTYNILIIIILWECVFDPATIYCPTDVQQVAVPGSRPCDIEGHANFKWSASHYLLIFAVLIWWGSVLCLLDFFFDISWL